MKLNCGHPLDRRSRISEANIRLSPTIQRQVTPSAFALRATADRSADCPTGKSLIFCPAPFAKIFPFPPDPNHFYIPRRPTPLEDRIAIVTDAGRDVVAAAASGTQCDRR